MKTPEEIAQWVIDNRYPQSEKQKVSDTEMYHNLVDSIANLCNLPVVVCSCCGKNTPEICGSCVSDIAQETGEQAINCR